MASRRKSVWVNTDIAKAPELDAVSDVGFRMLMRLPFLVDDWHRTPELSVIADDIRMGRDDVARLMDELVSAGFVDSLDDGALCMSALSRRFYSFSDPSGAEDGDGGEEVDA